MTQLVASFPLLFSGTTPSGYVIPLFWVDCDSTLNSIGLPDLLFLAYRPDEQFATPDLLDDLDRSDRRDIIVADGRPSQTIGSITTTFAVGSAQVPITLHVVAFPSTPRIGLDSIYQMFDVLGRTGQDS